MFRPTLARLSRGMVDRIVGVWGEWRLSLREAKRYIVGEMLLMLVMSLRTYRFRDLKE
jgi:hypothetical protein